MQAVQQATTVATKGTVNGCMLGCDTSSMDSGEAQIEAAFEAMARGAIMYSYFEPPLMNLSTGYENRGWTREGGAAAGYNETLFRWFYGKEATSEHASFVAIFLTFVTSLSGQMIDCHEKMTQHWNRRTNHCDDWNAVCGHVTNACD